MNKLTKEEVGKMRNEAAKNGKGIEVIPSKLVCTVKPAPNGGKKNEMGCMW